MSLWRSALIVVLMVVIVSASSARTLVVDQGKTGAIRSVNAALANAQNGDEILVMQGYYRESVEVNKLVSIKGYGATIDGMGRTTFRMISHGSSISNLTILGSGREPAVVIEGYAYVTGCSIKNSSTGIAAYRGVVSNNTISATAYGIRLNGSAIVEENTISGPLGAGIEVRCNDSTIIGNTVTSAGNAIDVAGHNNSIVSNNLSKSNIGIRLKSAKSNMIMNNTCESNRIAGVYLEDSRNNSISSNMLLRNGNGLLMKSSSGNSIIGNIVERNEYGISMKGSGGNMLRENLLVSNRYNLRIEAGNLGDLRLISDPRARMDDNSFNQSIDESNRIDGRPVLYLVGAHNVSIDKRYGFVGLIDCENITVRNQSISNSSAAIMLVGVVNSRISDCRLSRSEIGLSILDSGDCMVENTTAEACGIGFWFGRSQDILVRSSAALDCTESGFRLEGDRRSRITDSRAENCTAGMHLLDALSSEIARSRILSNREDGIRLVRSHRSTVNENEVTGNSNGIAISGSNQCVLAMNNASGNAIGIRIEQLSGGSAADNTALRNREGIFVNGVRGFQFIGNSISMNERFGMRMGSSSGCNITDNRFVGNGMVGLSLTDCNDNRIYHNSFIDNGSMFGQNAVDNGSNLWDMGPEIGGNYWSDHQVRGNPGDSPRTVPSRGVDRYPFERDSGWRSSALP
ncbi:MAG: NosD domain-containing protein [Methanothrix sp.]